MEAGFWAEEDQDFDPFDILEECDEVADHYFDAGSSPCADGSAFPLPVDIVASQEVIFMNFRAHTAHATS